MDKSGSQGKDQKITYLRSSPDHPPPGEDPVASGKAPLLKENKTGKVFLVGAGPGDAGLITLRARECIARADVIIYDYLVNPIVLGWAREDAEIVNMGKRGGGEHVPQEEITRFIVAGALQGKVVVRLKGGDPFIFGRGAEEAQNLALSGIPFEVVPGVTSAVAVSAYCGIPLTHRDYVSQTTLLTGHPDSRIAWDRLDPDSGTLVVYMGLSNLSFITANLIKGGWSSDTPVALVSRGTFGDQEVLTAFLSCIAEEAARKKFRTPALVIIGQVVELRATIKWFESKPLFGRHILITGSKQQAFQLARNLEELGALPIMLPTIKVGSPDSWEELDEALGHLDCYDYVVFPSINSVRYFFQRFAEKDRDIREMASVRLGAIGGNTVNELSKRLLKVDIAAPHEGTEDFSERLREMKVGGKRILIPGDKESRGQVASFLEQMGNSVFLVDTYRIMDEEINAQELRKALLSPGIHLVVFTSPASVRNFCAVTRGEPWEKIAKGLRIATVGPLTAREATLSGLTPTIMPPHFTVSGLVTAIVEKLGYETIHDNDGEILLERVFRG